MRRQLHLTVNSTPTDVEVETSETLATVLRERIGLTGTHIGCRTGNCGACTVRLDGAIVKSCCVLALEAEGADVETVEALRTGDELHPVQRCFAEKQALQCGFCTAGMVMAAVALLEENPHPTEREIKQGLAGNLCRCTGYAPIIDAIQCASERASGDKPDHGHRH